MTSTAAVHLVRRLLVGQPFLPDLLLGAYGAMGGVTVLAAWRLWRGTRWSRPAVEAFLWIFCAGMLAQLVLSPIWVHRFFGEARAQWHGHEGGPPAAVLLAFQVLLTVAAVVIFGGFLALGAWALRCARSPDVRGHAVARGF